MIGTLVNAGAVIVGGAVGMMFNKSMPERFKTIYFQAVGLFTMAMGIGMVYNMQNILIVVSSVAVGALLGEWMNIERAVDRLSEYLRKKLRIGNEKFSEGLVTSFLLFCIGAMTIVGAIDEGTGRSSEVLFTKSLMDGFFSASAGLSIWFRCDIFVGAVTDFSGWNYIAGYERFSVFYARNYRRTNFYRRNSFNRIGN